MEETKSPAYERDPSKAYEEGYEYTKNWALGREQAMLDVKREKNVLFDSPFSIALIVVFVMAMWFSLKHQRKEAESRKKLAEQLEKATSALEQISQKLDKK